MMEAQIKRWTARRTSALLLGIIQGRGAASRQFDLIPADIGRWVEVGRRGMGQALRAKPADVREQCGHPLKNRQEPMLKLAPAWQRG